MANTQTACAVLSSFLKDKVSYPGQTAYKITADSYFSAQEEELSPACIVTPESSEDVAKIIKTLAQHNAKFAVRGGGHTLNSGAANIEAGVTINLRHMNQVNVNAEKSTVSIAGGAKWGEVYPKLDGLGISTSGGRVADVGVGGLSTGGGISYYSARQGLVCDNIENYEIVTSDGKIINVNQHENKDLWIALKGGSGSNFGVVTRFDIRTFPQGDFLGGVIVCPISTLDSQLKAFADLLDNFDPNAAVIMSISWNQLRNSFSIFSNLQYTQPVEKPPALASFLQVQPQILNTMRISKLSDFAVEAGKYAPRGTRAKWATATFGGGLSVLQIVQGIWHDSISSVSSIEGVNWAFVIQPFPPAFSSNTAKLGGNSLGLNPADGPLTLMLLSYSWSKASDDQTIDTIAQKLLMDIDAATQKVGAFNRYRYLNYAASWQNPLSGYGEDNVRKLKSVSKRYDPLQLFQRNCPGGFKVSDS